MDGAQKENVGWRRSKTEVRQSTKATPATISKVPRCQDAKARLDDLRLSSPVVTVDVSNRCTLCFSLCSKHKS